MVYSENEKRSKLVIFSNTYKLEFDKRSPNNIEQDRYFNVKAIKEKVLKEMSEINLNNTDVFLNVLDEETRAICKIS